MKHMHLIAIIFGLLSGPSFAGPFELSYGGRLTEASGKPLSGTVNLRITFFRSATGNDQVSVALPDFTNVPLQDGVFQVTLNLSPSDTHTLFNGTDYAFIQVEDLSHGVTYPRQKFSAVPYALKVPVDGQSITYDANGKLTLGATGGAAGKFLKFDSPGVLVWDTISGGGDMLKSNNLSDLPSAATARTNLGLGSAATKNVGTAAGDVAAGNHTHTTTDVTGLGGLASKNAVGSSDITDGSVTGTDIANGTITDAHINATANISYLKISGLGSAASKNVGTAAGEVAAGDHAHAAGDISGLGGLATKSAVGSTDITDGSIADADVSATAAISGSKINPDFGAQNLTTTGSATASTLQANTDLKLKSDNANTISLQAPAALGTAYTVTLPADNGTNGQVLTTNGSGTLSWGTVSGGGGGGGDMFKADNLGGLANTATARTNLGLGALATKSAVGSSDITDASVTGGDIASGTIMDANINASAAISSSKISGLGGLATKSAISSSDITDGSVTGTDIADGTITDADINATANISYLKISGLGSAASKNVGTAAGEVAAGNHNHTMSAVTDAGSLATKSAIGSSDITDGSVTGTDIASGTITDANISASAAIAASKITGLGSSATKNVGTAAGDVAAGNHTHTMSAVTDAGALATKSTIGSSDITDGTVSGADIASGTITDANISASAAISTSKISGLGALATKSAVGSSDITDGSVSGTDIANGTITDANINATANISYLKISGLGAAATKSVGTAAGDVAAGNHTHTMSAVTDAGTLATKSAIDSNDITDDSIMNADINASAAIAGTKISPNFGAQNVTTTGNITGAVVQGSDVKATSYLQTASVAGAPAAADCDAAAEYGRLKTDTTNNVLYICSTAGWFKVGGPVESYPTIRFTRTTYHYSGSATTKDGYCSSEFGSNYVAAALKDVIIDGFYSDMTFNTSDLTATSGTIDSNRMKQTTTGGSYPVACIYKFASIRYTRGTTSASSSDTVKNNLCVTEFGSDYTGATWLEVPLSPMYNGIGVGSFNFVGATSTVRHSSNYKEIITGTTTSMACIRKQ